MQLLHVQIREAQKDSQLKQLFALSGSAGIKAARKRVDDIVDQLPVVHTCRPAYLAGSSSSSNGCCRLTKTEIMLNAPHLSISPNGRLTTSSSTTTTSTTASPHATTFHIDASNNVTVRALLYRAQSPQSPQDGEDGESTTEDVVAVVVVAAFADVVFGDFFRLVHVVFVCSKHAK